MRIHRLRCFVFGPKARDSTAQANGLGLRETPEIVCGLKGRNIRNQDGSGHNLLDDNCFARHLGRHAQRRNRGPSGHKRLLEPYQFPGRWPGL